MHLIMTKDIYVLGSFPLAGLNQSEWWDRGYDVGPVARTWIKASPRFKKFLSVGISIKEESLGLALIYVCETRPKFVYILIVLT